MSQNAAGWYPNGEEWESYWDGAAWTGEHRPIAPSMPAPPAPPSAPAAAVAVAAVAEPATIAYGDDGALLKFKSHIDGKNADVAIYSDRIEWHLARGVSKGKVTAGIMTGGLSMLATGVKNGKSGSQMIPVKGITGVTTKRDGMINTIVSVTSSSSSIGFRVSHKEAEQMRQLLNSLILAYEGVGRGFQSSTLCPADLSAAAPGEGCGHARGPDRVGFGAGPLSTEDVYPYVQGVHLKSVCIVTSACRFPDP